MREKEPIKAELFSETAFFKRYGLNSFLLALLFMSQASFVSFAQTSITHERFAKAEALMEKAVSRPQVPSISVAVSQRGKIVWEKAIGFANIEKELKATPATAYSLASISKPITATGLMILVEKKQVDLSRPVNKYLGQAKLHSYLGGADKASVQKLLNHTSGLVTHWHFFYADDPYPRPDMDETIKRYGVLIFPPGSQYKYSNLGYGILDYIIERVSGHPYPQFMQEEVFKPLGMTDSAVYLEPGPEEKVAQRYMGKGKRIPFYDFDHRGASAVYCSARDLVRFGMFHLKDHLSDQKRILTDETIDSMKTLRDPDVENSEYSLGWGQSHLAEYTAYSHGGGMPGVSTNLLLLPEPDIALVMLCNASYRGLRPIGQAILEVLIPGLKEDLAAEKKPAPKPPSKSKDTPESLLGTWTGEILTYEAKIPVELVIDKAKKLNFRFIDGQSGNEKPRKSMGPVILKEDSLNTTFFIKFPTPDAGRFPHRLNLDLKREGNRLMGSASVIAANLRYSLPSFISLTKIE
jgi:CubicO group peptidase (beta-lactamase class C family)